jgi:hypothetical protein
MANAYTPYLNLLLPEVGADTNAWGSHVNTDLSTIDAHILSRTLTTSQTAAGPMVFGQTFRVNGAVTFDNTLLVTGNTTLSGTSAHTGAATFASTVSVSGATTLAANGLNVGSGQLNVTGGNVSMSGNMTSVNGTHTGTLSVSGATTLASNGLNVGSGQLNVSGGNVSMSGDLSVSGAIQGATNTAYGYGVRIRAASSDNPALLQFTNNAASAQWANISVSSASSLVINQTGGSLTLSSGNLTASGNITAYSDAKLKENVRTIENAVAIVNQMRGVYYDRIDTGEAGIGVIAQEMRDIVPEVVVENDGTLSVAYGNLVGILIEAIKELSNKVELMEKR